MSDKLRLSLIQPEILWESIELNLSHFTELLTRVDPATEVVILPEMFSTGFTMQALKMAEGFEGKTFNWMREMAAQFNYALTGSFIFTENTNVFNRLVWMNPSGEYYTYDKRHLFSMGGEKDHYSCGNSRILINYKNWKILPLICYDLRFPVWSRNSDGYDILLYVANWPAVRSYAWNCLLRARAIENQSYVVAVNRIGKDGEGVEYIGESMILDPKGFPMNEVIEKKEMIIFKIIDLQELKDFRKKFPVSADADKFMLID